MNAPQLVLKKDIIERIKEDAELFKNVAVALNVSLYTLPAYLRRNDPKLTQKAAMIEISKRLKIKEKDLVEFVRDTELV